MTFLIVEKIFSLPQERVGEKSLTIRKFQFREKYHNSFSIATGGLLQYTLEKD